ncbi:thiamine-phosphate kinase [Dactylosporangium salmoneum]|uniref:Thiamine-monophosphate kinase n=1 Tax=Dactylosporangium salmoneum TaxID=53361 RepID=A0ABN3GLH6_9ACTN
MNSTPEPTLFSLGEKGFIGALLPGLYRDPRLVSGFGHDASVIELDGAPFDLIQKIDRASYPVSLKNGWSGYRSWGRMAITANCSDILASGGTPVSCMIAVMLPGDELAANAADIVAGAAEECRRNGVVFAGGDTKEARDPHVVGTAAGIIERGAFLPRDTAEPGDVLFCAGRFGGFGGAFFLLQHEHAGPDWVRYLSHPVAQWDAARLVNRHRLARCGMDASDGLLDVLRSLASGGAGVRLDLAAMPYHPFAVECARRTPVPLTQLLFAGGDWNIVYSVPKDGADELARLAAAAGAPLFRIGEVIADPGAVLAVDGDGRHFELRGVVNEHFKNRIEDATSFMDHIAHGDFLHPSRP